MKQLFVRRLYTAALALTLSTSLVVPVMADSGAVISAQEKIALSSSIGSVYISNNSYFQLEQATILPGEEGKIVSFKVKLHNGDQSDISFIDYWVRLQSSSGTQFSVNLLPKDKDKNRVPAGSEETITFYAKVNESINLQDLIFKIIRWDFSAANFERTVGEITVPWDYTQLTMVDEKRIVNVGGTQLKTSVPKLRVNKKEDEYFVNLTYSIENIGSKSVTLPAYTYSIRTPEGLLYPLDGAAAKDLAVHPRANKEVKLTATIPASIPETGWELVITELEATAKIPLPVAFYQLPASSADEVITPVTGPKVILVKEVPLSVSVGRVSMNKNDVNYQTTVYVHLENQGNESIAVPNYEFVIRTSEGISYPAAATGLTNLSILPRSSKDITLNVDIPVSVQVSSLELILNQPAAGSPSGGTGTGSSGGTGGTVGGSTDKEALNPVAIFILPSPTQNEGTVGTASEFSNKNGIYNITFNGIQRLPWEEKDIVTASLSLSGKSSSALPIPALTGYFLLDGSIKVPAKMVQTDSVISIHNEAKVGFQIYGTVPYTYDYSELQLIVQEKVSDTETNDLVKFKNNKTAMSMPFIGTGEGYKITGVGRNSSLSIRNSRTYNGLDSSLFAVQLSVENLEKRFTNISKLVGYFKTKDELMFPAQIAEVKKKVSPLGKAILNVTTSLPPNFDTSGMELIIGEGVKDGALADGATTPDAYINGVTFSIPGESKVVQDHLGKLDLFPFTLSINKVSASIVQTEQFAFSFDYSLNKNTFAESSGEEHKIIVEFSDVNGGVNFSQTYTLDKSTDPEVAGNLAVGQHSKTILKTDPAILVRLPYLTQYKVNIYDEFLGQKKLLASQTINWFVTTE
ncbi:MAG: hypothetical protein K0R67_2851 [Paenibacillus sp.]|nr:hypothetical protein [Paenibacillus sp.]